MLGLGQGCPLFYVAGHNSLAVPGREFAQLMSLESAFALNSTVPWPVPVGTVFYAIGIAKCNGPDFLCKGPRSVSRSREGPIDCRPAQ